MTQLMGILNVTPDSFYDQGKYQLTDAAILHAKQMAADGADLIDVGGESTRPGAQPVSPDKEFNRVIPVIKALKQEIDLPISIDTRNPKVAAAAVKAGASIINDVSGCSLLEMQRIVAATGVKVCVMHMLGTPQTMQNQPHYPGGVTAHLLHWFQKQIDCLLKQGIKEKQIILDPGIGFGKTVADNFEIIQNLPRFQALGFPLLYGISRKSFMGKTLGKSAQDLLSATLAINTVLIRDRVDFIRVHDVQEHRTLINLLGHLSNP